MSFWLTSGQDNANAAAEVLGNAGYEVSVAHRRCRPRAKQCTSSRHGNGFLGDVTGADPCGRCFPHARRHLGCDPQSRSVWHGDGVGRVRQCRCPRWHWGCVIASQSGHRLPRSPSNKIRRWPRRQWKSFSVFPSFSRTMWQIFRVPSRETRELAAGDGRGGRWGKRGARVNTISPGIIITPLAKDELRGPRGEATGA